MMHAIVHLQAYCSRKEVAPETYRYVYDGEYINPEAWPSLLEMEDNDSIDSFIEQRGGFSNQV